MGRYSGWGNRTELDGLSAIDTTKLKEFGWLGNEQKFISDTLTWTRRNSGNKSSIGIEVDLGAVVPFVRLIYTVTTFYSGEKKDYDYKIALTTSPCNYGGLRYWFICPLVISGYSCGRRARRLYHLNGYFGCRACHRLTYSSQLESIPARLRAFAISLGAERKMEELGEIKRKSYNGKPTKKMRRFMELSEQAAGSSWAMSQLVDELQIKGRKKS